MSARYRLVVIGPGDEVLGVVSLDGMNLGQQGAQLAVAGEVADAMGARHADACAALDGEDNDG